MERNKSLSSNKAITLVALIITIIVMLILVAVTVTVVVDSDIIGQAEDAGELYKNAYANEENKVSDETIEGEVRHNTIEGYLQDICEHNFVEDKCTKCELQLIKFTIDGTEYKAEPGMTWEGWIDSDYCKENYWISRNEFVFYDNTDCYIVEEASGHGSVVPSDVITARSYYLWYYADLPFA